MKGENTATTTTTVDELADIVQSLNIGTSVQQNDTRESEDTAQAGDAVVPDSHESEPEESQELVVDEAVPDVDNVRVYEPRLGRRTKTIFGKGMSSLDHIVDMISQGKAKKIVVMAGAGISTAAGIPDFRSPGTGLYANLAKFDLPYPEAIFTMDYFEENPKPFFVLAKELYPDLYIPTLSHFFVKLLESKGVLLRHYTQNIDCLDSIAGVSDDLVVEAHGSFKTAHCINEDCREEHSKEWVRDLVFRDEIPHCRRCGSLVKPDITFF
ncbi:NAD-dependent protein deacetylase sirtuin-2, partial [Linderina pennispora]